MAFSTVYLQGSAINCAALLFEYDAIDDEQLLARLPRRRNDVHSHAGSSCALTGGYLHPNVCGSSRVTLWSIFENHFIVPYLCDSKRVRLANLDLVTLVSQKRAVSVKARGSPICPGPHIDGFCSSSNLPRGQLLSRYWWRTVSIRLEHQRTASLCGSFLRNPFRR